MKIAIRALIGALAMAAQLAFALDLSSAKSQGMVGERSDGYLGLVMPDASADARRLVEDVNRQRRAQFEQIAARNGISVDEAAKVFAREAVQRTQPGNYIQGPQGWLRK